MGLVQPAGPRADVKETTKGLEIAIPSQRHWFSFPFFGAWLVGWFAGESAVLRQLLSGAGDGGPTAGTVAWLVAWTAGGIAVASSLFWQLGGVERLIVGPSTLAIRREVFGVGRSREYELAHVRSLRVSALSGVTRTNGPSLGSWPSGNGIIAFDYGSATIRFAASIDESEAHAIVDRLRSRAALVD